MLITHDQQLYLPAPGVAPAAFALAAGGGRYAPGIGAGQIATNHATNRLEPLGALDISQRRRGVSLRFVGRGADNSDVNYRLWAVYAVRNESNEIVAYELALLGSGLATFSTAVGGQGGTADVVTSSDRFADTITWSAGPAFSRASALFGAQAHVHSPADNTIACLSLSDVDRAVGVLVEFGTGSATSVNALIEVGT